jgi:hypothetical protein
LLAFPFFFSVKGTSDGGHRELTGKKEYYTKVYSDKHFKGDVLLLGPGFYDWKDLQAKHFDDRIESIYLPWGYKALLCEHPGLKGKCIWFKYSHGSVYVGDGVSSLKIVQWQW